MEFTNRLATELFRMEHEGKGPCRDALAIHASCWPMSIRSEVPGPDTLNGSCVNIMFRVDDVDSIFKQALGAERASNERSNKFYGDRMGSLVDPFGHVWHVGTHKEDVTPEEMEKRLAAGAHG